MTLQDYATEELRAELKRRKDLVKEERLVPTCDLKDGDILSYQTVRFATEEEKQKLFDAIKKKRGYKWNAETKTLEKFVEPKFNPNTLRPFDKVLVRDYSTIYWNCDLFSRIDDSTSNHKFITISSAYRFCIPYNDETKHLLGTSEEAPEYYRYWEG